MITYRPGTFLMNYDNLVPMFEKHWQELGMNGGPTELNLDVAAYRELEKLGAYKCYAVFDDDVIVGYISFFINRHLHHKQYVFATGDCFFVEPEYRKSYIGYKLIKFAEKELKKLNVSYIQLLGNTSLNLDKFMTRLGYTHSDTVYTKGV